MPQHKIFAVPFARIYRAYVQKAERRNRTKEEVDAIVSWLTGCTRSGLAEQVEKGADVEAFFAEAPANQHSGG